MAKQDDWIRITLRLPPELHEKLTEAAKSSSMNAEILTRLEKSFEISSNAELAIVELDKVEKLIQLAEKMLTTKK